MRLEELWEVMDVNRSVIVNDIDGERVARYDGRDSINPKYNDLEVTKLSMCIQADEPVFIVEVDIPTFSVTGTFEVEVEVYVKALCEEDAYSALDSIGISDYGTQIEIDSGYTDEADIVSVESGSIDWGDAELV